MYEEIDDSPASPIELAQLEAGAARLQEHYRNQLSVVATKARHRAKEEAEDHVERIRRHA